MRESGTNHAWTAHLVKNIFPLIPKGYIKVIYPVSDLIDSIIHAVECT